MSDGRRQADGQPVMMRACEEMFHNCLNAKKQSIITGTAFGDIARLTIAWQPGVFHGSLDARLKTDSRTYKGQLIGSRANIPPRKFKLMSSLEPRNWPARLTPSASRYPRTRVCRVPCGDCPTPARVLAIPATRPSLTARSGSTLKGARSTECRKYAGRIEMSPLTASAQSRRMSDLSPPSASAVR
ncbi:hypothetical protein Bbelb_298460 [Branchiostoma belcheri]|nr:hypothetical protein Bbelb_298460 [Branchiostoma belcheri]